VTKLYVEVVRLVVLCALLAACNARLGASVGAASSDASSAIDASSGGGGDNIDAATSITPIDAPPDASLCPTGRVVFLNFDGDTLTQAAASDATQDQAIWVGMSGGATTATMTKFRPTAGDRTTQIQDVVTSLQGIFSGVPEIAFVTTRPAAGPYVMIGFGGTMGQAGVPYTGAVNHLDCGDSNKNDVGWVFESASTTTIAANFAAGAIAFGLGATGTTDPNDCMCGWLTSCQASGNACSFSATAQAELDCPNETDPQNDVAILQAFCN
jgi:hypothetical protein